MSASVQYARPTCVLQQSNGVRQKDTRAARLPLTRDLTVAYRLSALAATLLLVTSSAGLLFGQQGLYRADSRTLPTFLGQDGITLAAGLPLLLGSMWLARDRHRAGSNCFVPSP